MLVEEGEQAVALGLGQAVDAVCIIRIDVEPALAGARIDRRPDGSSRHLVLLAV
jgi:hypothetical protein